MLIDTEAHWARPDRRTAPMGRTAARFAGSPPAPLDLRRPLLQTCGARFETSPVGVSLLSMLTQSNAAGYPPPEAEPFRVFRLPAQKRCGVLPNV